MSDSEDLKKYDGVMVMSSPLRTLPFWLSTVPESWAVDCFELSLSHSISARWGTA